METKDTLSSCSNSEEQQMQQIQDKAKESCMVSFRQLHSHLKLLSHDKLKGTRTESGFKRAFATLFGQDVETFIGTMFLNVDQLEKQLDKEEFQEIGSMASFKVNERQIQTTEDKVDTGKAVDANIRPINVKKPMGFEVGFLLERYFTHSHNPILTSEPQNGSNDDITNQYECKQTLDVSAGLALPRQMTSDHNSSELGIHDHSNELSSSKLVPKVVPPADKTATSRQELELLFHHHITMLRWQFLLHSRTENIRVILFSIQNDDGNPSSRPSSKQHLRRRPYALSWKPCQGDSLNLPDHRIHKDGDGDAASFTLRVSDFIPMHSSIYKDIL
ncbi:hypothetical protein Tco_0584277 [Tanacetum coccineum]